MPTYFITRQIPHVLVLMLARDEVGTIVYDTPDPVSWLAIASTVKVWCLTALTVRRAFDHDFDGRGVSVDKLCCAAWALSGRVRALLYQGSDSGGDDPTVVQAQMPIDASLLRLHLQAHRRSRHGSH